MAMMETKIHRIAMPILTLSILMLTLAVAIAGAADEPTDAASPDAPIRVSVASDGNQANGPSLSPSVSRDRRYVAFASLASNLVPGDTNDEGDVFVHDRATGETTRVSVASNGTEDNDWSGSPSISGDGRYVAFSSLADNLVPGDTNGTGDVFVHDRTTGETTRVSVGSDGAQGNNASLIPSISDDGRYVAFESFASNLVPEDTNEVRDVFVHDQVTGETTRVSVSSDGTEGNDGSEAASISGGGRYVAFGSRASNLMPEDTNDGCGYSEPENCPDVFVHDRTTGETTRVSVSSDGVEGNGSSADPTISGDGRYVAFHSDASNLVVEDTNESDDVFVHDRTAGETTRISVASDGAASTEANNASLDPSISDDGRYVAFESFASNLVPGDTNRFRDIFVHDRYFWYLPSYLPLVRKP